VWRWIANHSFAHLLHPDTKASVVDDLLAFVGGFYTLQKFVAE
jgi:hypothetical protein